MSRPSELAVLLADHLSGAEVIVTDFRGEVTVSVPGGRTLDALRLLTDVVEGAPVLTDLTAVDRYPDEPRFDVVYLLTWYAPAMRLRLKARVGGADPVIASATSLWAGANWLEREVYDMFGIRFEGHPNLTRILMPDDWEGYPLRKDFPLTEEPVEFVDHVPRTPSQIIPKSSPRS